MSKPKPTPPLLSGALPGIGHALEFRQDIFHLLRRGYKEHGDVFTIKLGPQPIAVVSGADHNRTYFIETDKALSIDEAVRFLTAAIGEVLFFAPSEVYENQRPLLQKLFSRQRMAGYVEAMNAEIERWIASLGERGEMLIADEMLHLTQNVAAHAFLGRNFRDELDPSFWKHYDAIGKSLDPLLPHTLPLPKFRARDKAKAQMREMFRPLIICRRVAPDTYDDSLSQIITTPLADGTLMDDETILPFFIGLLFAGHATTAGQITWTIIKLLQHPAYLNLIRAEIDEYATPDQPLDGNTLRKFKHVYWAIEEITRMYPSANVGFRVVKQPLEFGNYVVPLGWRVMINAANSHREAGNYTNPHVFDPLRHDPSRCEGNSFDIIGFGGGRHKCPGMNFAYNNMAIITTRLFQRLTLELLTPNITNTHGFGTNLPKGINIRYRSRLQ